MNIDLNYKPNVNTSTNAAASVTVNNTINNSSEDVIDSITNVSEEILNKPDIEYRPSIQYKESFESNIDSSGIENTITDDNENTQDKIKDKLNSLTSDLDNIFTISQGLSDDMYNLVSNTASGVSYVSGLFNPDYIKEPSLPSIELTVNSNLNTSPLIDNNLSTIEVPDNIFPEIEDTIVKMSDGDPIDTRLEKEFIEDMLNIFKDYTDKLNTSLNKYYIRFLKAVSDSSMQNDYKLLLDKLDTSKINVSNTSQFLVDNIVKSEIVKDQKVRLQQKLFNIDYFITNARQCVLSNKLRQRYYSKDYEEESSFLKVDKNTILSDLRREYDVKYENSLFNLYKYLNSSVILFNEALTLQVSICETKAVLIKEEGVNLNDVRAN